MKMRNLSLEHMVPVSLTKKNSLDNMKSTVFMKGTVKEDTYTVVYIYAHTLFYFMFLHG